MNAITPTNAQLPTSVGPAAPIRQYVADHYDGLWHAVRLLGGYEAARRFASLAAVLATGASLSRQTCRQLQDLLDLLMLENVHDPERVEMGCFAVIDPTDPCVEEICLLADGLSHALEARQQAQRRAARSRSLVGSARHAA